MIKEVLVRHFSFYLARGKSAEELQREALGKHYEVQDINDSIVEAGRILNKREGGASFNDLLRTDTYHHTKKLNKLKIVLMLLFLILIILGILGIFALLNYLNKDSGEVDAEEDLGEIKRSLEILSVSTKIFNESNSGSPELLNQYFVENPSEKANATGLSRNLRDCRNTEALFFGDVAELNGYLYIEDIDEDVCLVKYRSDLSMECNYTKEQLRVNNDVMRNNGMEGAAGSFFYFLFYFEIQIRSLGDLFKPEVNETLGPNLSLGEGLMIYEISRNFTNLNTGETEIVNCLIY